MKTTLSPSAIHDTSAGAWHAGAMHNDHRAAVLQRLDGLILAARFNQAQRRYRRGLICFAIAFVGLLLCAVMLFRAVFP